MSSDRWQRIQDLFHAALSKGASREDFVRRALAEETDLASEVLSLLAAHDRTGAVPTTPGEMLRLALAGAAGASEVQERVAPALRGKYEIQRLVGQGGMAEVMLAHDVRHGRPVALKVMRPSLISQLAADRFLTEIRLTARLHHPHILPLFDSGEADGLLFYVMPYVEGRSLQEELRHHYQLETPWVLSVLTSVASALDYAHAQGIVHRDIKPGNVLLREDSVFVSDFGIGLAVEAARGSRLTQAGQVLGTPAYMSPEQIQNAAVVDHRSDVYALGCMAYEMLVGEPPFVGRTPRAVMMRHLTDAVPPATTLRTSLTSAADSVLATALAKAPADRFASAGAFVSALAGALAPPSPATSGSLTSRTTPPASPPASPWRLAQEIRFTTARDGVRIAWASTGDGPPLVKASNWLSHLEYDADSPMWRHWWRAFAARYRFVRYDERGNGLSERKVADISLEAWLSDLEAVVDAAGLEQFTLLGLSKGGALAIAYAARHPERVSRLILHGAYARGRMRRDPSERDRDSIRMDIAMVRNGWGQENPAYRQAFTTMFFPEASLDQMRWFNDLQRISASPDDAARIIEASHFLDVRPVAPLIRCPTLVLHSDRDARVPAEEGRLLAALVPGATFVPLDSANHIPLEHEAAWQQFLDATDRFTGVADPGSFRVER